MTKEKSVVETPLMKQYNTIKAKYPDALLLFRVGDFYETFGEDAIKAAHILGIVLTRRANGSAQFIELAGFPHHSLDTYLPKLVRAGMRVAICDQLEDPKLTKTIVKRGVTELVTPGISINDKILDHKSNNFLATIHFDTKNAGVSFLDISTGEFLVAQGSLEYIDKLLQSFRPSEIVFQKNKQKEFKAQYGDKFYTFGLDEWVFKTDYANEILLKHFGTISLKGFGIEELDLGIIAAGVAMHYLSDTQHDRLQHIGGISRIEEDEYVWLDKFTIRNLELVYSTNERAVTLIDILDHTISSMGARLLRRWMMLPLKDISRIEDRLDMVHYFLHHPETKENISQQLKLIGDLERLISKVALGRISPREVVQLKRALLAIEPIKNCCENADNDSIKKIADQLNLCLLIRDRIEKEINSDPPVLINKGGTIAAGVSEELDQLRAIAYSGKDYLLQIQKREVERTGITSLKIAFNNVFGYYIEVTNTHKDKVPSDWIRKQTLVNAERYITEELKVYEEKILGAEDKILAIEVKLFNDLVYSLADYIQPIQLNAALIARLDCLLSFAQTAEKNHYVRPHINDSKILDIKNGRHPVIEKRLPIGEEYVANDIYLDNDTQQIIMITGPNMSGKSALLRQTALIVLMAQMGSFVPAGAANIGLIDKIFTRVGASDNISSGESTFMVEMNETASILNNISDRSLILLDEIGRGTSTYDGISIAWAIAEFLHNQPIARAKTLFATHYHELNHMTETLPRIKNFNVSVKELENKVLFLRKLVPGGSEHSFGIHVARMAGMPYKVIQRANEILSQLEKSHSGTELTKTANKKKKEDMQLSFFQLDDPLLEQIRDEILTIDINSLTPVEALMKLNEIKKFLGKNR
jgi:DNA mismatch repair protein MutS